MGKTTFILIIGSLSLFSIYVSNMNNYVLRGSEVMFDRYSEIQAKQLASSVVNMIMTDVADDITFRTEEPVHKYILGGTATYRVIDTVLVNPDSVIMIDVTATFGDPGQSYKVKAFVSRPGGWVPPSVRGAWTANADLNNTISDMYIDGRDHNLDGTINVGNGNFAVSSATSFTNVDEAFIGGTYDGIDVPATTDEQSWRLVIEQNVDWGGAFPTTPDQMLGYPEGTLMKIAKSGVSGSQYIMNPGKEIDERDLSFPLRGVTYVEINNGVEAKFKSPTEGAGVRDEGILIFHGPNASSRVKQVASAKKSEEPFVGIIIADYSFHHHIDILGSILNLSDQLESKSKCNGNRDHYVRYSSQAIKDATRFVAEHLGEEGNSLNGGQIGIGRKKALFWYE